MVINVVHLGLRSVRVLLPPGEFVYLCGVHFSHQKQLYTTLLHFTRMRLSTEEKIELGLTEQGTVNPAFGVSNSLLILHFGFVTPTTSKCQTLGEDVR